MQREMSHEAYELVMYTDNEADLYRQRKQPIEKNLAEKKARGTYDRELAVKGFMYLADAGAKKHAREFGMSRPWNVEFPISTRREAARHWAEEFEEEYRLGNLSHLVPKRYQETAPSPRRVRVASASRTAPARKTASRRASRR